MVGVAVEIDPGHWPMVGEGVLEGYSKSCKGRPPRQVDQVRQTGAVRCTESSDGQRGPAEISKQFGPIVLAFGRIDGGPYSHG